MTHAIRVHAYGGPEMLRWEEVPLRAPTGREVLVRQKAVGVNFIDIYARTGMYPVGEMPFIPGLEGAGIVEAVGPEAAERKVGDRVMYCRGPMGGYAEARVMAEEDLLPIPEGVSFEHAASALLRGLTAEFLLRRVIAVQPGMTILVHAAAGGVGLILCQWAAHLGATVIGTVGSPEKAALARVHGAAHTILYHEEDIAERVRAITGGRGCNIVYDSVGKATIQASIASLMRFGLLVCYGQSSGIVPPLDPLALMRAGSLFLTRPTLRDYIAELGDYRKAADEFFTRVLAGDIKITVGQSYYLSDAATAQADLEAGRTHGATVLIVE